MYFLAHIIVVFNSSVWEGRVLPNMPIDPVNNTLAVAVYGDPISVGWLRARKVVGVML